MCNLHSRELRQVEVESRRPEEEAMFRSPRLTFLSIQCLGLPQTLNPDIGFQGLRLEFKFRVCGLGSCIHP